MSTVRSQNARLPGYRSGNVALLFAVAVLLTALGFEYIGGYLPCPLCYQQRYAYYAGIPALFLALICLSADQRTWATVLFFLVSLAFLANAGFATYHAGAEWGFWPGPTSCAGASTLVNQPLDLSAALADTPPAVQCDQAALRVLGLSFAGWNVVACLVIFALALNAAGKTAGPASVTA
ncbi:MAG: disulfide bond formation protein B [Pseudomonadota bacterium]